MPTKMQTGHWYIRIGGVHARLLHEKEAEEWFQKGLALLPPDEVDQDYAMLDHVQWLKQMPKRKACNINLNIYTHRNLSVSKSAMNAPWKIPMLSQQAVNLGKQAGLSSVKLIHHRESNPQVFGRKFFVSL